MVALFLMMLAQSPAERAAQVCIYVSAEDRWQCDPRGLAQFELRIDASTDGGAGIDATFRPLPLIENPSCIAAIDVTLLSERSIVVDWPRATASQSGDIVALLTESARRKQAAPTREISEPGVPIHDVIIVHGGRCLLRATPPPGVQLDVFELRIPLIVDGKQTAAVWTRRAEWRATTELEAMRLVGAPPDPGPPPPEPAQAEGAFPTYTVAGGVIGGAAAVVTGAVFGLYNGLRDQTSSAAADAVTSGICCGACSLPVFAGALAGGGFFLDRDSAVEGDRARLLHQSWLERRKARDAYTRRMDELSR